MSRMRFLVMKGTTTILLFLLIFTPHIAQSVNEQKMPEVMIQFPSFYAVNISGAIAKNIGVVGIQYTGRINITNFGDINKDNLEDTSVVLRVEKLYSEFNYSRFPIYNYNRRNVNGSSFNDSIPLSKCKECGFYDFDIAFLQVGTYLVKWQINVSGNLTDISALFISIVSPIEHENLIRQRDVSVSQKEASMASRDTATATNHLAYSTFLLAFFTLLLAIGTVGIGRANLKIIKESKKDRTANYIQNQLSKFYTPLITNEQFWETDYERFYDARIQVNPRTEKDRLIKVFIDAYRKYKHFSTSDLEIYIKKLEEYLRGGHEPLKSKPMIDGKPDEKKIEEYEEYVKGYDEFKKEFNKQLEEDYKKLIKELEKLTKDYERDNNANN